MERILIDADKCVGCKSCSIACMLSHTPCSSIHDLDLTDPRLESRNTILLDSDMKYKPLFCRHCDRPECVVSCMSGAMAKDPGSGHVGYDPGRCGQCFMCVMNCPYGVLKPDRATRSYVVKCDFCLDSDKGPNCVRMCPKRAIYVKEV